MAVEFELVNQTKKEVISFCHLPGSKKRELTGGVASSAIVTWYMLSNQGDQIQFVSDTYGEWPFNSGSRNDLTQYTDVTEELIQSLIKEGILQDEGYDYIDDEDPENIYIKKHANIWCSL